MKKIKNTLVAIFSIPILIIFSIFTFSNTDIININLWPLNFIFLIPVWLAIISSLFLGIIIGSSIMLISSFKSKLQTVKMHSEINELKKINVDNTFKASK